MNASLVAILTAAAGLIVGGAALVNAITSRPKVRSETMQIATQAATEQIQNLRADNTDVRSRLKETEKKNTQLEEKNDLLEQRVDAIEHENDTLKSEKRILVEFARRSTEWMAAWYDAGHPPGMAPPPQLQNFEKESS